MNEKSEEARDLALIGAGYWGINLARNFHALGVLHTICDSNQLALAKFTADYGGVETTPDLDRVLSDRNITKVAIAAPAAAHFTLAKAALLAGKDVFVEKPLCLEANEGNELATLASRQGHVLMVGHLLQYHPCIQRLQSLIAQGELGKLHYITSNRLNLGKIRREENALWSFAPHDISVILSLAANRIPGEVRCLGEAYLNQGIADTTLTTLRFADRLRAHIYVSWLNPFKEQKLTVVGSNGMVVFDDTRPWNEKLVTYRHNLVWIDGQVPTPDNTRRELVEVPESEPLRNECAHFIECCRERRKPKTDAHEGLRVLRVLQAAQRSLDSNGEAQGLHDQSETDARPSAVSSYYSHPTAIIDAGALIGAGTKIWHFSHVMKGARIGERCVLGQNVNVDGSSKIGNNVKIQNNVSVYSGIEIEDDVFLGPSCVLTNVTNPRSQVNRHALYEKTVIRRGATIGANATIVCGLTIGRYAFVGAGAVVTKDVPDYALVIGNPARQAGWMSRHGHPLKRDDQGLMTCPESGLRYIESPDGNLYCTDLDEEQALPANLTVGKRPYDELKRP